MAFLLARRLQPRLASGCGAGTRAGAGRAARAVFPSRWLVTPLGPSSNYVACAASLSLPRFMAASIPPGDNLDHRPPCALSRQAGRGFRRTEAPALKAVAAALGLGL
ncbi:hypothetical protein [Paracoccus beibuensis]|uniref:hypothetical protein n=1 Tax=Paracoccus beibuensis TaxID=547602 RepID=UPI00223F4F5B|nr:hypothetical protein [Paracoccus beibuensis]